MIIHNSEHPRFIALNARPERSETLLTQTRLNARSDAFPLETQEPVRQHQDPQTHESFESPRRQIPAHIT